MSASPQQSPVSLEVAIGQMIMVGFRGLALEDGHALLERIGSGQLGAVVLFDIDGPSGGSAERNIASPDQLRRLLGQLHAAAPAGVPLLVGVDQEGGRVRRLKETHGFADTSPSAADLGRTDDPALTHQHALSTATALAEVGINLNLAPAVDVDVNPANPIIGAKGRSYSADPDVVVAHAAAFIEAHHERGVLCTLKHFPGHGSSTDDTHVGFTDVTDTWSEDELVPFARLIDRGLADSIMTAHVFNSRLDPQHPATLSAATLTGLLRGRLGYDGVVISDDLGMGAIARSVGFETAVEAAIIAGVDVLALANQTEYEEDIASRTAQLIGALVADGKIDESRIRESHRRISLLKERVAAPTATPASPPCPG